METPASTPSPTPAAKIVDAHFHLWDLEENCYPWLMSSGPHPLISDTSSLRRSYRIADFQRDASSLGVVAGVHIQAQHDERDPVRETRWLQRVADDPASRGMPQAIVANADLASADVERVLEGHCAFANTRGIRQALHRQLHEAVPHDPLLDPVWVGNFPLLKKYRLSFDLQLFPRQVAGAVSLIRGNPDVQFVLTHMGMPFPEEPDGMAQWQHSVRAYAQFPNVAVKISAFGRYDPTWNSTSIDPIVSEVIDSFTPARCMLGSNFPIEGLVKRYADIWRVFFEYFAAYSVSEREMLFWRNAASIYRIAI